MSKGLKDPARAEALGAEVYLARIGRTIKVGVTAAWSIRAGAYRRENEDAKLLASYRFKSRADAEAVEGIIKSVFLPHLAKGTEYFRRSPWMRRLIDALDRAGAKQSNQARDSMRATLNKLGGEWHPNVVPPGRCTPATVCAQISVNERQLVGLIERHGHPPPGEDGLYDLCAVNEWIAKLPAQRGRAA